MATKVKKADYYIIYEQDEDGYFIATCPSIKGCVATGKTLDEAYQNIHDAIESCLEALEKMNKPIPEEKFPHDKIAEMSYVKIGY